MKNEDYLRLLIVEKSENNAESLANVLRNAGHSIHFDYARDAETFAAALLTQQPDIVLCGIGKDLISANSILDILAQHELSLPVIAIAEAAPETAVVAARKSGMTAMVSYDQPDHLVLTVSREVTVQQLQKKLAVIDAALNDCENRCNTLIENSSDAIAYIYEGMHYFSNQAYMDLFGITNREEIEKTPILDMISEGQRDTFKEFLGSFEDGNTKDNTLEIACVAHDGTDFESAMELTPASIGGEPCTQIIFRTGNTSMTCRDGQMMNITDGDTLTGLFNRQHFMNLLDKNVNSGEKDGDERALIYITLDGFKEIREENGIVTSDAVLCDIAKLLKQQCNKQDRIARFGDYSFTILYHDSSPEKIQAKSEKLLHEISTHMSEINGQTITMTCSIGVCAITEHTIDAQKILSHADTACEVARSSGGNRIHTHSAVIDEQMSDGHEKEWDDVIRKTFEEERFYLAYQPIISLTGDNNKRYEALLRIVDEEGHTILPGQFLKLAEIAGLSRDIDYWIFDTAFRKISEVRENGEDITIFMKLGTSVLADTNLPEWILGKLKEYNIPPGSVVFELQELDAINDLKSAITFVKAMKNLQCRVAMEHFGINNQPQLLKHVSADILKIDGSLTENLAGDKDRQSRIKELVQFAHDFGTECIVERVDNPGCLAILWKNGVDMIQGNFIQEPSRELGYNFDEEIA